MIRYALSCDQDHAFESWFQSAEAFDKLQGAGMVACPECGSTKVTKSLMAPRVRPARKAAAEPAVPAVAGEESGPLTTPRNDRERALAELRRKVEENSEYVGMSFAAEARAMHEGDAPGRSIWGEAKPADAKALIEDGIPVTPLPFMPQRKTQ
ncbi:DUF1178 family protein [Frigidibacter sp. ROC022]|uniref:DUF1178 family protein n=1 Tax=Frigidibacter sp. ROC022 TaxID=2971796 RepID=UPI00215AABF9|nr:DUF1178 family protein [Frigidibacter sp. ROC022]MCR8726636.1 DUF1178 family protein [Frigidibacter sp. ROC022]